MLNGSTLKICFLMIVITLCTVVLFVTVGVIFFKFPIDESKAILGMMGISALFGGITQAFIHSNIAEGLKIPPPGPSITTTTSPTAQITPITEVKP